MDTIIPYKRMQVKCECKRVYETDLVVTNVGNFFSVNISGLALNINQT
jgi:hypothetical protein